MKKILITTSSFNQESNSYLKALSNAGFVIQCNPHQRRLSEEESMELLDDGCVVGVIAGVEPLTERVLRSAPNLKVISRCGIGLDNVDLLAASRCGIKVVNTPKAPAEAVAELTIGLMINLIRKITLANSAVKKGDWRQLMGNLLSHQVVGIIGYGHIGRRVSEILKVFGAKIIINDVVKPHDMSEHIEFRDFDSLISESNIVSLHIPYSVESHHLFDSSRFSAMKPGSFLINTSRGGLIDEVALKEALTNGHLAGAAIDVFEEEPYQGPLINIPEAILTAHMGSYAKESRLQMESEAARNLLEEFRSVGLVA